MCPQTGEVIGGKYRIIRLIGDGGMGAVYEARHEVLGSPVALKFLHPELAQRMGLGPRFLQEARVSASIQSPHVTRVTDVDQTADGTPFLVMELLSGESLQSLLDRELKIDLDRAVDFSLQVLSGLEAAHALGVVHRDLKPDNVFITPSAGGPVLKLLDFGIAKLREASNQQQKGLTRPGAVMGTPEYMAPEQLYAASQVDHRADLYSLGAMLYEMLSGERPADGDDAVSIIAAVAQGHVRRLSELVPTLPSGLVDVVHRAIAPDRDARFASAMDLRLALVPFAGRLSHAGRLAAASAPIGSESTPPPPEQLERQSAVPRTLPPDGGPVDDPGGPRVAPTDPDAAPLQIGSKGSTQDVPQEVMRQLTTGMQAATPAPAPAAPGGGYGPPPAGYAFPAQMPVPTTARRRRGRGSGLIAILLLGLLVTGGAIATVLVLRDRDADPDPGPIPTSEGPSGTVSIEAGADPGTSEGFDASGAFPPPPLPPGPGQPAGPGPGTTPPRDAGASADAGAADAGTPTFPGLPPFPSTLPPLPTTLPSSWQPIPGVQWPPPSQ